MRKPDKKNETIVLRYELLEANRIMANRNKSQYAHNHSLVLYQRVYSGNGVRLLLARSKTKRKWVISYTTHGKDMATGLDCKPHFLELAIQEKCTLTDVAVYCGKYWSKQINPELAAMNVEPTKIFVCVKSLSTK